MKATLRNFKFLKVAFTNLGTGVAQVAGLRRACVKTV